MKSKSQPGAARTQEARLCRPDQPPHDRWLLRLVLRTQPRSEIAAILRSISPRRSEHRTRRLEGNPTAEAGGPKSRPACARSGGRSRQGSSSPLRASAFGILSGFGFRNSEFKLTRLLALSAAALLALGSALLAPLALAGLPQPMCVYYGQARDGYGIPYRTNAEVILLRGTQEIARQTVQGSLTPGVNFELYVHLDDGRTANNYSARAVRSGEAVTIVVRDQAGQHTVMEQRTVPTVGQPGSLILINATTSEDADNDGLPDTWERELVDWSGGAMGSIWDVKAGDDFDGDGVSNGDEYRAGTYAFLDYDYFFVEYLSRTPNHRLCLTFLSVPGKCYAAHSATNLSQAVWAPCGFGLSDSGVLQSSTVEGTGDWLSLFVPIEEPRRFIRLTAQ